MFKMNTLLKLFINLRREKNARKLSLSETPKETCWWLLNTESFGRK